MNGQLGFGDTPGNRQCDMAGIHAAHGWFDADGEHWLCAGVQVLIDPHTHARSDDPEAAKDAAKIRRDAKVLACLKVHGDHQDRGGLTDDDLGPLAGFPEGHETYRRRGGDLRAKTWTIWLRGDDDKIKRGRTILGGTAGISVLTPKGIEEYKRRFGSS